MDLRGAEKILVIDDSVQITRLVQEILLVEGYRVVVTNEPEMSQDLVREERPDLIIVDVCMPGLDGWELCRLIRQEHTTPILVLTVLAGEQHEEVTLRAGATAHMAKPFQIPEFLDQVRYLLHEGTRRTGPAHRMRSRSK